MPEEFDIPDWVSERHRPAEPPQPGARAEPQTRRGVRAAREREAAPEQRSDPHEGPGEGSGAAAEGAGRHRPGPKHRGPSRRVRLHRTLAGATTVALLTTGAVYLHAHDDAESGDLVSARATLSSTTPVPVESTPSPSRSPAPTPTPTPSPTVRVHGPGTFTTVALPSSAHPGAPSGARVVRIGFQIEDGLGIDPEPVARKVARTLSDKRGWERADRIRFRFVTAAQLRPGEVDITVRLASPDTTDRLCAPLKTNGVVSCFNNHTAVLNARRWLDGVPYYADRLDLYRTYMVNHEVGHGLGHGHAHCPSPGAKAPTMQQQTLRMEGCVINPYPTVA